jgi:hypothetical protein
VRWAGDYQNVVTRRVFWMRASAVWMQNGGLNRAAWFRSALGLGRSGVLVALAAGCSSDASFSTAKPVDFAGTYAVSLTNGASSCPFMMDWVEGMSSTNHQLTIHQSGDTLEADAEGVAGLALWAVTGTASFSGSASGPNFTLTAFGTKEYTEQYCTFTVNAQVEGTLRGDAISGDITYTSVATTESADCQAFHCEARQAFSGTRPPTT